MRIKICIVILLLTVASLGFKCGGDWSHEVTKNFNTLGIPNTASLPRDFRYTSAKGAIVESTKAVPQTALDALDRGFSRRIVRFDIMFPAWTYAKSVRGTRVLLINPNQIYTPEGTGLGPCRLESIPGAPCLYVKGIKTAGTVLGTHDLWDYIDIDPPIVLPHQADGNWQWLEYLAAAAHNEDEHRAGWLNRRNDPTGVFYRFLGYNDAHPQCWGNVCPPYEEAARDDDLQKKIPHYCLPVPTEKELKEIADELGISVDDLKPKN